MMDIDIKDVITLDDDKEYVVVSKVVYKEETYFYIVDINISNNEGESEEGLKILKLNKENQKLVEFDDKELIKTLLPLFLKETANHINKENSENK